MFESLDDTEGVFRPDDRFRHAVVARGSRLRRRRRRGVAASSSMAVTVGALVIGGLAYVGGVDADLDRVEVSPPAGAALDEGVNVLLVGTDARPDIDGERADVLMVVRIGLDGGVSLLSIPRDLYDPTTGDRLNGAVAAGPQAVVDAVDRLVGLAADHYVELGMEGLVDLTDALGGVDVQLLTAVRDSTSGLGELGPGCTNLDGAAALALVRSRMLEVEVDGGWRVDGSGDLGRVERQQAVLAAAAAEVLDLGLDVAAIDRLIGVVTDHVAVDAGLSLGRITELARTVAAGPGVRAQDTLPVAPLQLPGGAEVLQLGVGSADVLARYGAGEPLEGTAPPLAPAPASVVVGAVGPCEG